MYYQLTSRYLYGNYDLSEENHMIKLWYVEIDSSHFIYLN